jgi:hypothetical protein
MLTATYADCHIEALYAKCRYAECHYAECRYAECHGAFKSADCLERVFTINLFTTVICYLVVS